MNMSFLVKCRSFQCHWLHKFSRTSSLYFRHKSSLGLWQLDINTEIKQKIEEHWSDNSIKGTPGDKSLYVLPMFPYPSGNLHMGHVRVYSISDAIAIFHKLNGFNVIHPIGWDAFGLPAENAAIERNIPPRLWTNANIDTMKNQLKQLKFDFDWDREMSTCDPKYYKWTQYIFLKLYENGLAYQDKALVNWDPVDKTVLADEQVDEQGCSWRSGARVEKKVLTQWFVKTTKFAQNLFDGLQSEYLEDWKDIIDLQKHWIGECNGVVVTFTLSHDGKNKSVDVWTSEPYKFVHGQFITIGSDNIILQEITDTKNLKCLNPITESEMPVFITDNANYAEGRNVHIACPKYDEDDKILAQLLNFPFNNEMCNPINIQEDNKKAIEIATNKNVGGHSVSSKLKDWLISRQRYWGTPIPIIHCPQCGTVPVPYEQLPVKLPEINTSGQGIQTLENVHNWVNCTCPKCHANASRETDTMDTFVDSSWYFYRFLDVNNDKLPFDKEKLVDRTPINIYIGGKEHAVLHLYYARFMSYFLHSLGWTPTAEPFKRLLVQGMIMGQSYKLKSSGRYLPPDNIEKIGKEYREKNTGESVLVQWEKMSKSKYNGENPERLLSTYGCDTTRLLILADVPPETTRRWSDATLPGVLNWQRRLWMTMRDFLKHRNSAPSLNENLSQDEFTKMETKIRESRNYLTATTTYHFKYTYKLSVGISRLQSLTNALRNNVHPEVIAKSKEFEMALAALIIMLTPITPHFCSELWAGFCSAPNRLCHNTSLIDWNRRVLEQQWPKVDEDYKLSFLCKVDGADRCELKIKAADLPQLSQEKALQIMLNENDIAKRIKTGISKIKYELYPDCRAILYIYTIRMTKPKQLKKVNNINAEEV